MPLASNPKTPTKSSLVSNDGKSLSYLISSPSKVSEAADKALVEGIQKQFPIENAKYRIDVSDIRIERKDYDEKAEKDAIMTSRSLTFPVKGRVTITDKATGKVVDEVQSFSLADCFYMTGKHTMIYKGNNYVVSHLLQLKEGVYHRRRSNGSVMAQINSGGGSLEVSLDPRRQTLFLTSGDINVPLIWVLHTVYGYDKQRASAYIPSAIWDKDVAATTDTDSLAGKLYRKVAPYAMRKEKLDPPLAEKLEGIRKGLASRTLDAEGTAVTLGRGTSSLDGESLLRIAGNLINIHMGRREEDNRDSLMFKRVVSYPDMIARRFEQGREHENVTDASRKIKWALDKAVLDKKTPTVRNVIVSKPYNKVMQNFLTKSTLSQVPSETNPIESLENVAKATVLGEGEGGIDLQKANNVRTRNIDPTHLTILDPNRTPESSTVGVDLRFAMNAARDAHGNLYGQFVDGKGKTVHLSAKEIMESVIGFKGSEHNGMVQAQDKGTLKDTPVSKVQYWVADPRTMFTVTTNMVPFLNSNHPGRLTMAGKAIVQALSLKDREAPLVAAVAHDTPSGEKVTFSKLYGQMLSTISPVTGTVTKVTEDGMHITDAKGQVHKVNRIVDMPYNQKGFRNDETALVKEGDKVSHGQVLYDNNYTRDGELALGRNLVTAYMPFHGFNHEDGVVISEAAAEKMASNHAYKYDHTLRTDTKTDRALFRKNFPSLLTSAQLAKLDSRGFVQKGTTLVYGDPVWALLEPRQISATDVLYHRVSKHLVSPYLQVVEYWKHQEPGVVIDVNVDSKEVRILVKSVKPLEVGDKLTGFHGNKGVVSKIVPTSQMPYVEETGKPVDIISNPASVTSRINLGQILESGAGRVAAATGKQYKIVNFSKTGEAIRSLKKEMEAHGIKGYDTLVDPVTGKKMPKVFGGPQYFVKTYKTTDSNYSARNVEGGYDSWLQPSKGGDDGSKRTAYMEFLALLGSDARKNLKEMSTIKAEKNEEFWRAFQNGDPLPRPKTTFATNKFFDYLRGSGIDVRRAEDKISLAPLTDAKILEMSNGEVNEGRLVARTLKPEKGGMFDPVLTGGPDGTKWTHYKLAEPIVNPTFEMPVKSLLKLSADEFDRLTEGSYGVQKLGSGHYGLYDTATQKKLKDLHVGVTGAGIHKKADEQAYDDAKIKVGGEAFKELLGNISVDDALQAAVASAKSSRSASARDSDIKQAKYLRGLQRAGFSNPADAYVLHHIPVVPPVMRPFTNMGGNNLHFADVNQLYNDHILISNTLKKTKDELTPDMLTKARGDLYKGAAAVMGLGDNIGTKKQLKGFIRQIAGEGGPKTGVFHDRLLARKQDFSGRATIYAAPDVGFNEARIPVDQLWVMYKYHILRILAKQGLRTDEALDSYTKRDRLATAAFNRAIKDIPIILNRAPSMLRTNEMAVYPVPTNENTIGLNILHLPAFAADFDGDAMTMHLPMTPEAIQEAKDKMLPMRHLHDVRKGYGESMFAPGHESILGSVFLTKKDETLKTATFATEQEAIKAMKEGKIAPNQEVIIGHTKHAGEAVRHSPNQAEGDPKQGGVPLPQGSEAPWMDSFLVKPDFVWTMGEHNSGPETGTGTSLKASI
jgi:DNA-directed RNA polymerase beta subunit